MFEKVPSFRQMTRKASLRLMGGGGATTEKKHGEDDSLDDLLGAQAVEVSERSVGLAGVRMKHVEEKLVAVLRNKGRRDTMLKEAKKQYCEESIRFFLGIMDWELIVHDQKKREMMARKLVATFVESGAEFENGCISSATRDDLLLCNEERVEVDFFEFAKQEVLNDIWMNLPLRQLVETEFATM